MSTIWTPGGEYVPREEPPERPAGPPPAGPEGREPTAEDIEAAAREQVLAAAEQFVPAEWLVADHVVQPGTLHGQPVDLPGGRRAATREVAA